MKRQAAIIASVVAIVALSLAACSPAAVNTTATTTNAPATSAPATTSVPSTTAATNADVPQYGGTITVCTPNDIVYFDEVIGWHAGAYTLQITNEELLTGDWANGPAGTGKYQWLDNDVYAHQAGNLAESWEMPEPGHWIVHIRQGVHYALNPDSEASRLVNGREFTADDAAAALNSYLQAPTSYIAKAYGGLAKQASVEATDKYTLEIKAPESMSLDAAGMFFTFSSVDIPPEVVQKYGNMKDWHVSVGTGPFILTDFVSGSEATLVRNPKFWMTDPVGAGKGNQLPYVNGMNVMIIPDSSTRLAGFRTGKFDMRGYNTWDLVSQDDAQTLLKAIPDLKSKTGLPGDWPIGMRTDEAPFNDIRVRQALIMATDYDEIIKSLNGGEGYKLGYPQSHNSGYEDIVLTWDEAPQSIKDLYTYNPDKAKQLLTEAGYPDGFKTTMTLPDAPTNVDRASVLKDMWSKVGVDVSLNPMESGAFSKIAATRSYEGMIAGVGMGGGGIMLRGSRLTGNGQTNMSYVNDSTVNGYVAKMELAALTDWNQAIQLNQDLMKYAFPQAWGIPFPTAPSYTIWWPWLKNFYGDSSIGYFGYGKFAQFAWIDQAMKKSMGH